MKTFEVRIELEYIYEPIVETFIVNDDATEKEIEEKAREIVFNYVSWSYEEIDKLNDEG